MVGYGFHWQLCYVLSAVKLDKYYYYYYFKLQAVIGISFAVGFIIGPMIGALFASQVVHSSKTFFFQPALFAVFMTVLDIIVLLFFFKESLPKEKRVNTFEILIFMLLY